MFQGIASPGRVKAATGQVKYGLKHKVHSKVVSGMGEEYYGPLQEGQTWSAYQTFMSIPIVQAIVQFFSGRSSIKQIRQKNIQSGL